jgi:phosphatidylglycerol:prolipoprotein diacylglycerol transferase
MILAKVACFVNGCCYGAPTSLPWALNFPEGAKAPPGIPRHPTQLYEIVVLIVIAFALQHLYRARWRGTLLLWFVMLYGLGRPATEWLRAAPERVPTVGPLTASQAVCMVAAVTCGIALSRSRAGRAGGPWVRSASDVADAAARSGLP